MAGTSTGALLNSKGMTIIEIVIVAAVSLFLLGGMAYIFEATARSQQRLTEKYDQQTFWSDLTKALRDPTTCQGNFEGIELPALNPGELSKEFVSLEDRFLVANSIKDQEPSVKPAEALGLYRYVSVGGVPQRIGSPLISSDIRLGNRSIAVTRLTNIRNLGNRWYQADFLVRVEPSDRFPEGEEMTFPHIRFSVEDTVLAVAGQPVRVTGCSLSQRNPASNVMVAMRWPSAQSKAEPTVAMTSGHPDHSFTVTFAVSQGQPFPLQIFYEVANSMSSADPGTDFTIVGCPNAVCSVTIPANETTASVVIDVLADGMAEATESFALRLISASPISTSPVVTQFSTLSDPLHLYIYEQPNPTYACAEGTEASHTTLSSTSLTINRYSRIYCEARSFSPPHMVGCWRRNPTDPFLCAAQPLHIHDTAWKFRGTSGGVSLYVYEAGPFTVAFDPEPIYLSTRDSTGLQSNDVRLHITENPPTCAFPNAPNPVTGACGPTCLPPAYWDMSTGVCVNIPMTPNPEIACGNSPGSYSPSTSINPGQTLYCEARSYDPKDLYRLEGCAQQTAPTPGTETCNKDILTDPQWQKISEGLYRAQWGPFTLTSDFTNEVWVKDATGRTSGRAAISFSGFGGGGGGPVIGGKSCTNGVPVDQALCDTIRGAPRNNFTCAPTSDCATCISDTFFVDQSSCENFYDKKGLPRLCNLNGSGFDWTNPSPGGCYY